MPSHPNKVLSPGWLRALGVVSLSDILCNPPWDEARERVKRSYPFDSLNECTRLGIPHPLNPDRRRRYVVANPPRSDAGANIFDALKRSAEMFDLRDPREVEPGLWSNKPLLPIPLSSFGDPLKFEPGSRLHELYAELATNPRAHLYMPTIPDPNTPKETRTMTTTTNANQPLPEVIPATQSQHERFAAGRLPLHELRGIVGNHAFGDLPRGVVNWTDFAHVLGSCRAASATAEQWASEATFRAGVQSMIDRAPAAGWLVSAANACVERASTGEIFSAIRVQLSWAAGHPRIGAVEFLFVCPRPAVDADSEHRKEAAERFRKVGQ